MSDYYKLLGVDREADDEIIKTVYRKLALKYHPDVAPSPSEARRFLQIQEAYDVLSDPEKRRAYDASLAARRRPDQGPPARRRSRKAATGSARRPRAWDFQISLGGIDLLGLGLRLQGGEVADEKGGRDRNRPEKRPPARPSQKKSAASRARPKALPSPRRPETPS